MYLNSLPDELRGLGDDGGGDVVMDESGGGSYDTLYTPQESQTDIGSGVGYTQRNYPSMPVISSTPGQMPDTGGGVSPTVMTDSTPAPEDTYAVAPYDVPADTGTTEDTYAVAPYNAPTSPATSVESAPVDSAPGAEDQQIQQATDQAFQEAVAARSTYNEVMDQNVPASYYYEGEGTPDTQYVRLTADVPSNPVATVSPPEEEAQSDQPQQFNRMSVQSSGGGSSVNFHPVISVPTNVVTSVSPQISPTFVQQTNPTGSGVNTGITQTPSGSINAGTGGGGSFPADSPIPFTPAGSVSVNPLATGVNPLQAGIGGNSTSFLAIAVLLGLVAIAAGSSDNGGANKGRK